MLNLLVDVAKDPARGMLSASLVVIHDARRGGESNVAELAGR